MAPEINRRRSSWLTFTAGIVVGVGGFVAVRAVRRRLKEEPPPGPSATPGESPGAAGPEPVTAAAGRRPASAPDRYLRALFLMAVLITVAVVFCVHRLTADTFEPATSYPSLTLSPLQPWGRPADNLRPWPPATTGTPTTSPYPAGPSPGPQDGVVPRRGLVSLTTKVLMRRLNGDRMTVSIGEVDNAQPRTHETLPAFPYLRPARGHRLVFVELEVRNSGYTTFPAHVGLPDSSISDRAGHVHHPDVRLTDAANPGPESGPLAPDWLLVGLLVFEVEDSTRVTSFRFGPWPAVSRDTQEWSLAGR